MQKQQLPPVLLTSRRYQTSIPQGKIGKLAPTQVPIISKKGTLSRNGVPLSMHDLTDPSMIDQKLRSLSHHNQSQFRISLETQKKQKANLKFLSYKFNPGQELNHDQFKQNVVQKYGQYQKSSQKITINMFYQHKNVLFQDQRAPLTYKQLFLSRESVE